MGDVGSAASPDRVLSSADHWRWRAMKMRNLAEAMHDPVARRLMARIADDYDELAQRADERAAKRRAPSSTRRRA
jgi:hypothetical protein